MYVIVLYVVYVGKYMIKTQSKAECKFFMNILPQYVKHLHNYPNSLLVRFYGMYRVTMKSLSKSIYFVIMSSVFYTEKPIHIKYDLKGRERSHCAIEYIRVYV